MPRSSSHRARSAPPLAHRPSREEVETRTDALLALAERSAALCQSTLLTLERIAEDDDDAEVRTYFAREFPGWETEDVQALLADYYARTAGDDDLESLLA